ncbi:PREDICTED: bcl-2-like protein 10 [Nanorana parkeri]|uniref:bcl-2-like protein 10 n=1 Tax=Nanorana parkeri TaxID=125878 RepID=UPI0008546E22|nr:PREDICTED: bcl-2-like protein 10 [Nanorana parkeri]
MEDQLLEESRTLLEDYLRRCAGEECQPPPTPVAQTLWRVSGEILHRNRDFYESCEQLPGDSRTTLEQVAARLPEEGGLNWGRVIGLITFAGVVLRRQGEHKPATPNELAEVLSRFLVVEHRDWFQKNGKWEGFYKFCNKNETGQGQDNSMFSNALMAAAGFGIAGLVFLLTVR